MTRRNDNCADIAIVGGGLQGCCLALELARQGVQVTLIEQDHTLMNRASLRNEGKIHLGLVYANDSTMETGRFQLQGALSFGKLLERWTGCPAAALGLSTPFNYLVANDSLLSVEELRAYYDRLTQLYFDFISMESELDYLGTQPAVLATVASSAALWTHHAGDQFIGGFSTAELAIDTVRLAKLVRAAVGQSDRIRVLTNVKVEGIVRNGEFLDMECNIGDSAETLHASQVVNATWSSRLAFDLELGLDIGTGWVHRLKFRVIVRLPASFASAAPSATVVVGPYGDVVIRPDSTAYLSWYPAAMRGWSHEVSPPAAWEADCREEMDPARAESLASEVIDAINAWYPGIQDSQYLMADAGIIFAYGRTDIGNSTSGLHRRVNTGSISVDGYHSVNPSKLTTAPIMAILAARRIIGNANESLGPLEALIE